MANLMRGDMVRRRTDDLLMQVDCVGQDIACCIIVESHVPERKILISLDALILDSNAPSPLPDSDE
ncbi:hypothetical protein UXA55_16000 [Aeromonas caviae]|jgi:hypothetical protein|uniref:hypothetical protein n=1 Tax=Aeromonas TaxID=642 RepID=UPI0029D88C12|nr:hypothetical protein [Aeromonas caviae]MDX7871672.1 hypothetical protein [Aeromonas caviae]MDY7831106.1 hypothetical protein [Aeromonas caviae]